MIDKADSQWHLDKKVPIVLIATIVLQTIGFVGWFSSWQSEVGSRLAALEKTDETRAGHEARIIVIEQKIQYIADGITDIKQSLRNNNRADIK